MIRPGFDRMSDEYDVFLSYCSADKDQVEAIAARLQEETSLRPFFSPWHLVPGDTWIPELERAIERSTTVAVFCGTRHTGPWQEEERQLALIQARKHHKRVIPVVLPGGRRDDIDGFLLARTWVELESADGFLRLCAGIRGKKPVPGRRKHEGEPRPPLRVLVASTYRTDEELGRAITETIELAGMVPVVASGTPAEACREALDRSDVLLLVVAWRYGLVPDGHARSLGELCYEWACARGMPRIVLLVDEEQPVVIARDFDEGEERWSKQLQLHAFKTRLRAAEPVVSFTHENLGRRVNYGLLEQRDRRHLLEVEPKGPPSPASPEPGPTHDQPSNDEDTKGRSTQTETPHDEATPHEPKPEPTPAPPKPKRTRKQTSKPRVRTPSERELSRYLDVVERDNAKTTMIGTSVGIEVPLRVDDLRVKVRIAPRRSASGTVQRTEHSPEPELPLHEVFSHATLRGCRGVVLVGHPGSGKSTHVRRMALWLSRRSAKTLGLPADTVPVLLPVQALSAEAATFREVVAAHLRADPRLDPAFIEALLAREHLVFLLDGVDELPDERAQARVARWLDQCLHELPHARMLVTRRPLDETTSAPEPAGWLEVQLPPLDEAGARTMVRRWFRATARDEVARDTALDRAEAFLGELRAPEYRTTRMFELTRNPLMLTALCVLHGRHGRLPTRRVDLFEQCVQVFLERWRETASVPRRFGEREARQVLQPLAHWLHEGRHTHADAASIAAVVEPPLRLALGPDCDALGFVQALSDAEGLLARHDAAYGFLHLGFQQYLCARHLRALSHGDPDVIDRLAERLGDPWWREVTLLLLALGEPALFDPFMRRVVARAAFVDHQDWITDCIHEAVEVTPAPFVELLALPPGDDPELWRRQLAAWRVLETLGPQARPELAVALRTHPLAELRRAAGHDEGPEPSVATVRTPRGAYELVEIPAGSFMMGSHHRERDRRGGEGPKHEVELARFFMGKHPVTNEEYGYYLSQCPDVAEPAYWGDPRFNQPRQPVVGVSWHEAMAYCAWAGLTLPTEAQWEYACRAGSRGAYWFGRKTADLDRVGWYAGNSGQRLHAVGEKDPNPFGLFDVHGNVWEWCQDGFGDYGGHLPRPGDGLRHAPQDGGNRMIRGGSWIDAAHAARSAYRLNRHPDNRLSYLGFRAVKLVEADDA